LCAGSRPAVRYRPAHHACGNAYIADGDSHHLSHQTSSAPLFWRSLNVRNARSKPLLLHLVSGRHSTDRVELPRRNQRLAVELHSMLSQRSRSLLWAASIVVGGVVAEWIWSRTRNPSLVERILWGATVLGIVCSQRAKVWLIEILDREPIHNADVSAEDRWFGRALQIWLFPLGLALIADPLAQSYNAEHPEGVALAVMFAAIFTWSIFVLEPTTPALDTTRAGVWWQLVPRRPTISMLAGFVAGGLVIAGPLYINGALRGVEWMHGNWAPVVVGAFIGSLLALTRWVAVMSSRVDRTMGLHGDAGAS
jgi:hypothetical protein